MHANQNCDLIGSIPEKVVRFIFWLQHSIVHGCGVRKQRAIVDCFDRTGITSKRNETLFSYSEKVFQTHLSFYVCQRYNSRRPFSPTPSLRSLKRSFRGTNLMPFILNIYLDKRLHLATANGWSSRSSGCSGAKTGKAFWCSFHVQ